MEPPLVTIFATLVLVAQLPKSGCGRTEGSSGVFTRVPSMIARDFNTRVVPSSRDSDYPVYRVVTRPRQSSEKQEDDEKKSVTQVMGGEPYTGGLEHRLAHVKKFGSFAGERITISHISYRNDMTQQTDLTLLLWSILNELQD